MVLIFSKFVLGGDTLENNEQGIELRHYVLRFVLVAVGGEVGNVAEQDRDVLVAPRNHAAGASYLVGSDFRQQCVQQLIGLLARLLGPDQRFLQREMGSDPGQHNGAGERLVDVINCANVESLLFLGLLGLGGKEDDGNVSRGGNVLQPPTDLVAVHAWHHHVEQDEIGLFGAVGNGQRLLAVGGNFRAVGVLQHSRNHGDVGWRVVHDQHQSLILNSHNPQKPLNAPTVVEAPVAQASLERIAWTTASRAVSSCWRATSSSSPALRDCSALSAASANALAPSDPAAPLSE